MFYRRPMFARRFYRPFVWRRRRLRWGFGGCALMLTMLGCATIALFVLVHRF